MQYRAWEKHDLVLLRHNALIVACAHIPLVPARIVEPQLSAFKLARFAMEKVDKRQSARCNQVLRVVTVRAEKVAVIAGRDLSLRVRNGKLLNPKLIQHPGQHATDSVQYYCLMPSQIQKHPRAPMVVVDRSRLS